MRGQAQALSSVAKGTPGARDDWRTPQIVLDRVRRLGPIVLDPCGNLDNSTGAQVCYSGPDGDGQDGLTMPWPRAGEGLTFANYPYSDSKAWLKKAVDEARFGAQICVLAPARPDTKWFRMAVDGGALVGFWRGRLTFEGAPSPAPFPSVLFFFNCNVGDVFSAFYDVCDLYNPIRSLDGSP